MSTSGETGVGGAATVWDDLTARVAAARAWGRRLGDELIEFPETLRRLREGAANFEVVGKRLEVASASLEEMTSLYQSTIVESARRSTDAVNILRSQIDALTAAASTERMSSTLADVQRTFESLTELNPFWPRSSRSSRPSNDTT